jgi:hypothetical protein
MRLSGTKATAIHQYRGLGNQLWDLAGNRPSLDLRFAESKSLVDATTGTNLIDFSRASSGTYVGSDGLIKTATTNLLLRSEEFDNSYWTLGGGAIAPNATTAPDGTLTADLYTTIGTAQSVYPPSGVTVSPNTIYTFSVYVKLGTMAASNYKIAFYDVTNAGFVAVDVVPSQIPTTDTWTRIVYSVTTPASCTNLRVYPFRNSLVIPTSTVYLWGAQLERSSTVGEYIKTTSTINSAPRFDHDPTTGESLGLLVEESRTNLLPRSEEFETTWAPVNASVSPNATTAPNGTITADTLLDDSTNSGHLILQSISSAPDNTLLTSSCYCKAFTRSWVAVTVVGKDGSINRVWFNLSTGAQGATNGTVTNFSAINVGNGWYRIAVTASSATGGGSLQVRISIGSADDTAAYIGNGSGIYIWGAQLEAGSSPTSYIPTTNSAVTRAASLADLINSAIANNIRSFYVEFRSPASGTSGVVSLNDNTANERAAVITSGTDPKLVVVDGGTTQADIDAGTVTAGVRARVAVRIGANDFAISINGGAVVTDTSGTLPTMDRLMIGRTQAGEYLNGTIARYTGWTESLADSTLQSLTQ